MSHTILNCEAYFLYKIISPPFQIGLCFAHYQMCFRFGHIATSFFCDLNTSCVLIVLSIQVRMF